MLLISISFFHEKYLRLSLIFLKSSFQMNQDWLRNMIYVLMCCPVIHDRYQDKRFHDPMFAQPPQKASWTKLLYLHNSFIICRDLFNVDINNTISLIMSRIIFIYLVTFPATIILSSLFKPGVFLEFMFRRRGNNTFICLLAGIFLDLPSPGRSFLAYQMMIYPPCDFADQWDPGLTFIPGPLSVLYEMYPRFHQEA